MKAKGRKKQQSRSKAKTWVATAMNKARSKPVLAMAAAAGILAAGVGVGLGVAHLFPHAHHAHPIHAVPAPPVPPKPETAEISPPVPALPSLPPVPSGPVTGDDVNGPAEVPPTVSEPTVKPPPADQEASGAVPSSRRPAWQRNAVAAPSAHGKPMIAVVIDDMGLDRKRAEKVIALPAPLTLSFMTYAQDLPRMTAEAHAKGHELMVHMPMQPQAAAFDAGPEALTVGASDQDLRQRIDWGLTRFDGYVGINNHMGSRFTEDSAGMAVVMQELSKRGLLFLDSVTTAHSVAAKEAAINHVPFVARQVFLDNEQSEQAIAAQLGRAEEAARKHGFAIAIGHPHDSTIAALGVWLASVKSRGFVIVPVTAVAVKAMEKG